MVLVRVGNSTVEDSQPLNLIVSNILALIKEFSFMIYLKVGFRAENLAETLLTVGSGLLDS